MSEQLTLEQILGNGRTIHLDQGVILPRAVVMDRPGSQILAGPCLPGDENGGIRLGDPLNLLHEGLDGRGGAEDPADPESFPQFFFEPKVLFLEILVLQGLLEGHEQGIPVEGLGDVIIGPFPHGFHGHLDTPVGGNHDDDGLGVLCLDPPQHLHSIHVRHFHVGNHDAERLGFETFESLLAVRGAYDLVAFLLQVVVENLAKTLVIVDQQNPGRPFHSLFPSKESEKPYCLIFYTCNDEYSTLILRSPAVG